MKKLKQILCAILNFGHPYEAAVKSETHYNGVDENGIPYLSLTTVVYRECSCGKVWERKR